MARCYWERTLGELEAVFDRVAGPERMLRLDRLEIELGQIEEFDWESEFQRRLIEEVGRSLAQYESAARPRGYGEPESDSGAFELFVHFLIYGRLPWWAGRARGKDGQGSLVPRLNEAEWVALRGVVIDDPRARARLVDSMTDELLQEALCRWAALPGAARVLEALTPAGSSPTVVTRWRRRFWITVFELLSRRQFRVEYGPGLWRELLNVRGLEPDSSVGPGKTVSGGTARAADPFSEMTSPPLIPEPWRAWQLAARTEALDATERAPVHLDPDATYRTNETRRAALLQGSRPRSRAAQHSSDAEAIYLEGAGAIILHPFLGELFRDRDLLSGRDFRDRACRERAVQLLGWMTFARAAIAEFELPLAKLLCGLELAEPLEPAQLDEADKAACDSLLRAVLKHWTAIRSTSIEWMRQGYFLRDGKLEPVEQGWRLTVERHAQDVLLDRLPWGLGVIDLPWMPERIFVHWLD